MPPRKVCRSQQQRNRLGTEIRARRVKMGLSQEQLGEKAECERNYIGRLEKGQHDIGFDVFVRIATALNTTIGELGIAAKF